MISLLVSDFQKISVSVPSIPVAVLALSNLFNQNQAPSFCLFPSLYLRLFNYNYNSI